MLFADVDGLKPVNDELGHLVGDSLIQRAAACIEQATRRADLAARIGGDEFAVLLYDTDEHGARRTIEKIEQRIADDNGGAHESSTLSVAFGAATIRTDETIDAFVTRADTAMYQAKRAAASPPG